MTVLVKTPITQITIGNSVAPSVANLPHANLEANIDDILAYIAGGQKATLNYDDVTSSGLTFAYTAGRYATGTTNAVIAAGSIVLTASSTNYIQLDPTTTTIIKSVVGILDGNIGLWSVTTDASNILVATDIRTIYNHTTYLKQNQALNIGAMTIVDNTTNSVVTNPTGKLLIGNTTNSSAIELYSKNSGGASQLVGGFGGANANASLYYNGSKKFETTTTGVTITGGLTATGGVTSNTNMLLTHTGADGYLQNSLGTLNIQNTVNSALINLTSYDSVGTLMDSIVCGGAVPAVTLNYNNTERLQTTSAGGTLTGTWNATTNLTMNGIQVATVPDAIAMALALGS